MKLGKTPLVMVALVGMLAMAGCASTLFFPAKPAEIAADKVIDDIWPGVAKPATANVDTKKP